MCTSSAPGPGRHAGPPKHLLVDPEETGEDRAILFIELFRAAPPDVLLNVGSIAPEQARDFGVVAASLLDQRVQSFACIIHAATPTSAYLGRLVLESRKCPRQNIKGTQPKYVWGVPGFPELAWVNRGRISACRSRSLIAPDACSEKLKQPRPMATCYDETSLLFESFLNLAAARLWLKTCVRTA